MHPYDFPFKIFSQDVSITFRDKIGANGKQLVCLACYE